MAGDPVEGQQCARMIVVCLENASSHRCSDERYLSLICSTKIDA